MSKWSLGILALSSLISTITLADDYLYVNATHLNIRAEGTFRSAIVATVDSGYKVTVLESLDNGWRKVLLENGKQGYVNGRYLVEQTPYFEKAEGGKYSVSVPQAFIRDEGLTKKIAVLHKGDSLEILDEKVFLGKWLRVKVSSAQKESYINRIGYISKKLVTIDEGSRYANAIENAPTTDMTSVDNSGISDTINLNSAPLIDTNITNDTVAPESTSSGNTSITNDTAAPESTSSGNTSDSTDLSSLLGDLLK